MYIFFFRLTSQVTTIEDSDGDENHEELTTMGADKENERASTLGRPPRSNSLGRNKGKKPGDKEPGAGQFRRTASLKEEKNKAGKEATVKPAAPPEKEKEKGMICPVMAMLHGYRPTLVKKDRSLEIGKLYNLHTSVFST